MIRRNLVVIAGSSGVGKTTVARALQEALLPQPWLHFSADTLFYCLPRSVTEGVDQLNDRSGVDSAAIVAGAYACAATLLGRGHKLVFDAVILSEKGARGLLQALGGFEPLLVELTCAWPELERRTLARGDRTLAEVEHGHRHAGGHLAPHLAFDSSNQSAQQIAARIAEALRA